MTHRTIDQVPAEAPEMEQILEAVLLQALEIAKEKLDAGELLVPFTALAVGETLFIETHPAEDPNDCFKMAQHTVQHASGALAYAFCYDGYVETDEGELDAIIAEGGVPGGESGHAVGHLYTVEGEGEDLKFKVDENPLYIGQAPNFMEFTGMFEEGEAEERDYEGPDDIDDAQGVENDDGRNPYDERGSGDYDEDRGGFDHEDDDRDDYEYEDCDDRENDD